MKKLLLTIVIFLAIPATSHALSFNGTTGGVTIANGSSLHASTSDMTFSAWIKPRVVSAGLMGILGNANSGAGVVPWVMELNRTAARFSYSQAGTGSGVVTVTGATNLQANKWYHVVATRKYNSTTNWPVVVYVNGRRDGSGTIARSGITPQTVAIGRYGGYTASFFNGEIADVRIYNRALSDLEVKALYNGYPTYQGLLASWSLEGNAMPFVPSNSPTIYNGTASAGVVKMSMPPIIKKW